MVIAGNLTWDLQISYIKKLIKEGVTMKLTNEIIHEKLNENHGWIFKENRIEKQYNFKDFVSAMKFVNKLAEIAEKENHHPDILIFEWNKVKIMFSTHDEGGVTEKDFRLAKLADGLK